MFSMEANCPNSVIANSVRSTSFIHLKILVRALIILVILALAGPCLSQGQKIDSLKTLLENDFGPARGEILYELAYHYTDSDNKVAMTYINQATKLIADTGDSLLIVKCGRLKSLLYRRFDEMDSSMMLSEKILPIAERNKYKEESKKILNGLALVYSFKAMYDKALTSYLRILDASDPQKNKEEYSVALNNVGLVYFKLDDLDKALYYFNRSLALKDESSEKLGVQMVLLNIALCHVYQRNYTSAKEFTDRVLSICKNDCSSVLLYKTNFNFGLIAYGLKELGMAEKYFLKSYELVKKTGDEVYELDNLIYLFQIYIEKKNAVAAKKLIKDADAILMTKTYYTQGTMELYGQLARVYNQLGNIQQVAHNQAKYIQLRDSVYDEQLTTNLMKVEADYLERENKAKIEAQAKILDLSDDVIVRQRAINVGVCIVAILSIAIVVILTQNVKQKRLANFLLEQKVKERTMELETHHIQLLKSLDERNQQMKRVSADIKSSMATIKGLCQLSLQDVSVSNAGQYIDKIERASDDLRSGIYRTLGISENGYSNGRH